MQIFSSGPTSPDLKRKFLEASLLEKLEAENGGYEMKPLSDGLSEGFTCPSAFTQGGVEVHGSHPLFYWTRSRGEGFLISLGGATVLLHYSVEMKGFVLVRPVGNLDAISDLVNGIAEVVARSFAREKIVIRYCSFILTERLKREGWARLSSPLLDSAYADDETWPEVTLVGDYSNFLLGYKARPVRKSISRYNDLCGYRVEECPLEIGESDFILSGSYRATFCGDYEASFNRSLASFLKRGNHTGLRFHYLNFGSELWAFGITGRNTNFSHCYYSGVTKQPRLNTYLLWKMFTHERSLGAQGLNLGGSEVHSLYTYKANTFPAYHVNATHVLERNPVI